MRWASDKGTLRKLNNSSIITDLRIDAYNRTTGETRHLNPKSIAISNGILSFIIDDFYIVLTQGSSNLWELSLIAEINYRSEGVTLAESTVESSVSSSGITYFGTNIMYVDLSDANWDGFVDITASGKKTSIHISDYIAMHSSGVSKDKLTEYVGGELNVNFHKQTI